MRQPTLDAFLCTRPKQAHTASDGSGLRDDARGSSATAPWLRSQGTAPGPPLPFHMYRRNNRLLVCRARCEVRAWAAWCPEASERPVRLAGAPRMEHPWAAAPVLSFAVEDRGEYAVCHQRGAVRLYDVREWVQPGCRGPPADLLSLSAHRIRDRRPGLGGPVSFGFSTVLFPDTTLHLLCGYHRAPMVDMFDLECVDEDTSDAARSFSLQGRGMGGGSPHPSCLAALAAPSAIAGLSDGGTLLLDPRVAAPVPGTGFHCRGGNTAVVLGQRVPLERRPSTAAVMSLAVVAQGGAPLLLSGSRDGTLALWDLRQLAHPVAAELHTGAITGIAHAGGAPHAAPVAVYGSRAVVGTSCGRIMEYAIGPTSLMQLGEYDAADAGLSDATSSIPSTRVALNAAGSLALLPHATHNAVMLLRRCSSPFSSATAAQREPFRAPGDRLEPPPGSQPRRFGSGAPVLPPGDPLFEGLHTLKLNEMAAPRAQVSAAGWLDRWHLALVGTGDGRVFLWGPYTAE